MTNPITPPPELVQQWLCSDDYLWGPLEQTSITITTNRLNNVATQSAQYGADQELEACIANINTMYGKGKADWLRSMRRPRLPSLKQQALLQLDTLNADLAMHGKGCNLSQIRRALESLPND